jgi:4-amino-4-deoxy-L-arabinose transferase-like glycosyltransferase
MQIVGQAREGGVLGDRTIAIVSDPRRPSTSRWSVASGSDGPAAAIGVAAIMAILWLAAGWTGDAGHAGPAGLWIILTGAPWAIGWLAAAAGFGWPLCRWLLPRNDGGIVQIILGIAAMLWLDAALGRLGALQLGGGVGAWAVLGIGWLLLVGQVALLKRRGQYAAPALPHWLFWLASPAIATLLLASCSAPGWLWSTEFGGYDALSYHLQLPKEWLALGRIEGLDHNVYSFLPGSMEAAYYHLAVLIGDGLAAAYADQMLHAGITLLTAVAVVRLLEPACGRFIGAVGGVLVLATPWTIVVGSLAYNEMTVALLLAGALLVLFDETSSKAATRRGLAIGCLVGAACGAKLTSVGFVALPVGILLLTTTPSPRALLPSAMAATIGGVLALAPALIGNAAATGNPLFPFATGIFGHGHWTAAQTAMFIDGHQLDGGLGPRVTGWWNQLLRYGIGANPDPAEPWLPQWSILPWLALLGGGLGLTSQRHRLMTARMAFIICMQMVFWLGFTHVKSRFMLPAVVPMAALAAIGIGVIGNRLREPPVRKSGGLVAVFIAFALGLLPLVIFAREQDGRPAAAIGALDLFTGAAYVEQLERPELSRDERLALTRAAPAALWINHLIEPDAQVLAVGDATPFYFTPSRVRYQTVWDRGPMWAVIVLHPDDPSRWMAALRRQGFTHLLVDATMLRVWEEAGWNAPQLTADRVLGAAEAHANLLWRSDGGRFLYRLPENGD